MRICYSCFKQYDKEFDLCPYCGEEYSDKPKEPIHLFPGTILNNRYILGSVIGAGGFGIVYAAYDKKLECVVAIKEFYPQHMFTRVPGEASITINRKQKDEYEHRIRRFLTEARYIAKYNTNKHILNIFDHFEENKTAYIVMERLKGQRLDMYLHALGGKLEHPYAIEITEQLCSALKDLHKDNIIHCDIAPDNIYISEDFEVKLFDFGAAKFAGSEETAIDICMKPGYSPPEQYDRSGTLGPQTDIYALGATLYNMVTGKRPDESTNRKEEDTVVPPHELDPSVPENLSNAIMKAMAVDKHMRYKNVYEFSAALTGDKKVYSLKEEKRRRSLKRAAGITAAVLTVGLFSGIAGKLYKEKMHENRLSECTISVWYSVNGDSNENEAMEAIKADFQKQYPNVKIELTAIYEKNYAKQLQQAADDGTLPNLFESSDIPDRILENAENLNNVLNSDQAKQCLFLEHFNEHYRDNKKIPLAIEVPMAFVINSGSVSSSYNKTVFTDSSDFGVKEIAVSTKCRPLISKNLSGSWKGEKTFMNNEANSSPIMLSSSMYINKVRETLTNYEKSFSYLGGDEVHCEFIYEWSIGNGSEAETEASEKLLSWMLGNKYQNTLMISVAADGQIPINEASFHEKCSGQNYSGIEQIYMNYVFD